MSKLFRGSRRQGLSFTAISNTPFDKNYSDPRADVSHKVGVYPVDDACINISHLEQRWNLWVSGTAIDPNHVSHAPGTFGVSDNHCHACFDAQKNGIRLGRCNGACMVNRHTPLASTAVLVQGWLEGPGMDH